MTARQHRPVRSSRSLFARWSLPRSVRSISNFTSCSFPIAGACCFGSGSVSCLCIVIFFVSSHSAGGPSSPPFFPHLLLPDYYPKLPNCHPHRAPSTEPEPWKTRSTHLPSSRIARQFGLAPSHFQPTRIRLPHVILISVPFAPKRSTRSALPSSVRLPQSPLHVAVPLFRTRIHKQLHC